MHLFMRSTGSLLGRINANSVTALTEGSRKMMQCVMDHIDERLYPLRLEECVAWDVFPGTGGHTLLLAERAKQVIASQPDELEFRVLMESTQHNRRTRCRQESWDEMDSVKAGVNVAFVNPMDLHLYRMTELLKGLDHLPLVVVKAPLPFYGVLPTNSQRLVQAVIFPQQKSQFLFFK